MSVMDYIRKKSIGLYFFIVFVSSWGLIIILAGPQNIPIDAVQSEKLLPLLYTLMLVGPGLAGLLLTSIDKGKKGFINLRSRLLKWRVGIGWYLLALLAAPIIASIILFALSHYSPAFNLAIFGSEEKGTLILSGIVIALIVGLFEEIGWSGFVIPKLRIQYNIFVTGIIVGMLWGAWHFILFWEKDSFSSSLPMLILLGRLFAWLPPFRVFMVWLLDRTESLLIVVLTHASLVFTTTVLVPMTLTGTDLLTWLIIWGASLWIFVFVIDKIKGGIVSSKTKLRK